MLDDVAPGAIDDAVAVLPSAFVPARPRLAESAAALSKVRGLGDVLPSLSEAGLLPASLAGVGFGVVCDACKGRGGTVALGR